MDISFVLRIYPLNFIGEFNDMNKEKLEGKELKIFEYLTTQDINYQN